MRNFSYQHRLLAALAVVFALFYTYAGFAASEVTDCDAGLSGYEAVRKRAHASLSRYVPAGAHGVYVTVEGGHLYAHTTARGRNHIPPGDTSGGEIRLRIDEENLENFRWSLESLVMRSTSLSSHDEETISSQNYSSSTTVLLDESVVTDPTYRKLILGKPHELRIIANGTSMPARVIRSRRVSDVVVAMTSGVFVNAAYAWHAPSRLDKLEFGRRFTRVLLVESNRATAKAAAERFPDELLDFTFSSASEMLAEAETWKGYTMIFVGHIDGDHIVRRVPRKQPIGIPIARLRKLARDIGFEAVIIGCKSAESGVGSGLLTDINSLDAVIRLSNALDADSLREFFYRFAGPEVALPDVEILYEFEADGHDGFELVGDIAVRRPRSTEEETFPKPRKNLFYTRSGSVIRPVLPRESDGQDAGGVGNVPSPGEASNSDQGDASRHATAASSTLSPLLLLIGAGVVVVGTFALRVGLRSKRHQRRNKSKVRLSTAASPQPAAVSLQSAAPGLRNQYGSIELPERMPTPSEEKQ